MLGVLRGLCRRCCSSQSLSSISGSHADGRRAREARLRGSRLVTMARCGAHMVRYPMDGAQRSSPGLHHCVARIDMCGCVGRSSARADSQRVSVEASLLVCRCYAIPGPSMNKIHLPISERHPRVLRGSGCLASVGFASGSHRPSRAPWGRGGGALDSLCRLGGEPTPSLWAPMRRQQYPLIRRQSSGICDCCRPHFLLLASRTAHYLGSAL